MPVVVQPHKVLLDLFRSTECLVANVGLWQTELTMERSETLSIPAGQMTIPRMADLPVFGTKTCLSNAMLKQLESHQCADLNQSRDRRQDDRIYCGAADRDSYGGSDDIHD
jgi:hypothetical protein